MAEKSIFTWPTNGTGDGTSSGHTATDWQMLWRAIFHQTTTLTGSRFRSISWPSNSLSVVSTAADQLTIGPGAASVVGGIYVSDANVTHTISRPAATTGGHIVLERNWSTQLIRQVAYRNTSGNTAIPALTQTDGVLWQLRICSFQITSAGVVTTTDAGQYLTLPFLAYDNNFEEKSLNHNKLMTKTVVDHTTNFTFTLANENLQAHTNNGATGTLVFTLPVSFTGIEYIISVQTAQQLRIDPNGSETIALPSTGVQGAAGKFIYSSTVASTVHIMCLKTGTWSIVGWSGTWAMEA